MGRLIGSEFWKLGDPEQGASGMCSASGECLLLCRNMHGGGRHRGDSKQCISALSGECVLNACVHMCVSCTAMLSFLLGCSVSELWSLLVQQVPLTHWTISLALNSSYKPSKDVLKDLPSWFYLILVTSPKTLLPNPTNMWIWGLDFQHLSFQVNTSGP